MVVFGQLSFQLVRVLYKFLLSEIGKKYTRPKEMDEDNIDKPLTSKKPGFFQFQTDLIWPNIVGLTILHVLGIYAILLGHYKLIFEQKWATYAWNVVVGFAAGLGVTAGAHRLWTHKAYKAKLPFEIILMILYTFAGQNKLYDWVRDHRQHHKFTDTDADPHNSKWGFFFSHVGWLMMRRHPEVIKVGKTLRHPDLEANPVIAFQRKYFFYLQFFVGFLLPTVVPIFFWNEEVMNAVWGFLGREVIMLNGAWCVNSVAHFYGNRPFNRNISATQNYTTYLLSAGVGEGWHNFHHVFPSDYRATELGTGFNGPCALIDLAAKYGWAYDLKTAPVTAVESAALKLGDGSYSARGESKIAYLPGVDKADGWASNLADHNGSFDSRAL